MRDALMCGRRFWMANVIDNHRYKCLGIANHFPLPAIRIIQWLDQMTLILGYQNVI